MPGGAKHHDTEYSEKRPLLLDNSSNSNSSRGSLAYSGGGGRKHQTVTAEVVVMKKHVTLLHAIGIIVGGVAGSGIFISPTGVTRNVGSVGLSLVMWTAGGLLNLLLAMCYAELGTAMPFAGGDYAYLHHIVGPLPAFLCLWTTVLLIGPCCGALMGRTVGTYIFTIFGVECSLVLVVLVAIWVNLSAAMLNALSVKWAARCLTIMSLAKLVALSIIIVTGFIRLTSGETSNFEHAFEGSKTDMWSLVGGFLPGFVAYVGWDAVNSLAEEMKNPGRDLPLSVGISMVLVLFIYILTNIAYFSVLTPEEFVQSDAVASLFAERTMGSVAWMVPIVVAMSAAGSAVGTYLAYPRYAFAGGREKQLPQVFSMVSLYHFTPIPGIILINLAAIFFSSAVFFDLQGLLALTSIITQFKMVLTLMALIRLKWTQPECKSTVKVPFVLVLFALLVILLILCLAVLQEPLVNGVGLLLFLLGIPIYLAGNWCAQSGCFDNFTDWMAVVAQQLFYLVPGGKKTD